MRIERGSKNGFFLSPFVAYPCGVVGNRLRGEEGKFKVEGEGMGLAWGMWDEDGMGGGPACER